MRRALDCATETALITHWVFMAVSIVGFIIERHGFLHALGFFGVIINFPLGVRHLLLRKRNKA